MECGTQLKVTKSYPSGEPIQLPLKLLSLLSTVFKWALCLRILFQLRIKYAIGLSGFTLLMERFMILMETKIRNQLSGDWLGLLLSQELQEQYKWLSMSMNKWSSGSLKASSFLRVFWQTTWKTRIVLHILAWFITKTPLLFVPKGTGICLNLRLW